MKLRIFTEPQQGASYDDLRRVAVAADDLGFDAFFRSDHYMKMGAADGLPGPSDAWVTLGGLARDTTRVKLGTLVTPITFRHPGPLAISVANVADMSAGRAELGIGAGWYGEEHAAYAIPFPDLGERFERLEEQLAIITGLWDTPKGETFSFSGKHYSVVDSPALPKPVVRPRIVIGGFGAKRTPRLAATYADEFNIGFIGPDVATIAYDRVRAACAARGTSLEYSIALAIAVGRSDEEVAARAAKVGQPVEHMRQNALAGSVAEVVDRIGAYGAIGATTTYLQLHDFTDVDQLELIASEVMPQL
ncbi:MAG TPA: LLM class F420-dependent oxidoreductase [Acidimicrobiales bacterium]|nr:LLM class F420-dependent oxidoreductase [Acidimicrobiales bacterium]